MRINYWTCSKFADWLRGTTYPHAAGFEEWDDIESEAKGAHPFRYWLADTGLRVCQDIVYFVPDKIHSIRYYLKSRFWKRTHLINTKLTPGHWYDCDTILMHGIMETIVDYVELECAAWTKGNKGRSSHDGLSRLAWEMSLVYDEWTPEIEGQPTHQAIAAKEVSDLYFWWTVTRPNRVDPYDELDPVVDTKQWVKDNYKELLRIEQEYLDEDDEMLCRVIKIRGSMWT